MEVRKDGGKLLRLCVYYCYVRMCVCACECVHVHVCMRQLSHNCDPVRWLQDSRLCTALLGSDVRI